MALSSTADYQLLVSKILYYIENATESGIDHYGFPVFAGIEPEDFQTILAAYRTLNFDGTGNQLQTTGYEITRKARPVQSELYPGGHGGNEATFTNGGAPVHTQAEPTQTPPAWPTF